MAGPRGPVVFGGPKIWDSQDVWVGTGLEDHGEVWPEQARLTKRDNTTGRKSWEKVSPRSRILESCLPLKKAVDLK